MVYYDISHDPYDGWCIVVYTIREDGHIIFLQVEHGIQNPL